MGWSGSTSCPFPFPASGDTHRHLQKKNKNTGSRFYLVIFLDLFKTFCSFFLPVCFSFADGKSSGGGLLRTLLGCC
jgi:hypothetical protein